MPSNKKLKAVIYARYSSDNQREASIEDQVEVCRRYADAQGFDVVEIYPDYALSGASRFRPAFQQMQVDADARRFDVIRMSLEVHLHPPLRDVEDENAYKVSAEVLERARHLGLEGDVEQQVKRMARDATPYHAHRMANLRHGRFALKVEGNDVTWIGPADAPRGVRKTK
jgi:hypothetical protein